MIATKDAVTAGLAQACTDGLIGIARGISLSNVQARYCEEPVLLDPSEEGVWIIPPFAPDAESGSTPEPVAPGIAVSGSTVEGASGSAPTGGATTGGAVAGEDTGIARVRRVAIRGEVPVESWGELFRCFVGPAARMNLKRLGLGVQFEMVLPDDGLREDDPSLKAMKESARQLGLRLNIEKRDGDE